MNFEDRFHAAVAEWMKANHGFGSDVEVEYLEQYTTSAGYGCETCDYTITKVSIWYRETGSRFPMQWNWEGDMGELMRELP